MPPIAGPIESTCQQVAEQDAERGERDEPDQDQRRSSRTQLPAGRRTPSATPAT